MATHYVIARYNEDISWADDLDKTVIQKGVDMPNLGREAGSYLLFIVNNYEKLNGQYYFLQGNPFEHGYPDKKFTRTSSPTENPQYTSAKEKLHLHWLCDKLMLPIKPNYKYIVGANFLVTAEELKQYTYKWYVNAFNLSLQHRVAWELERLWLTIYPNSL